TVGSGGGAKMLVVQVMPTSAGAKSCDVVGKDDMGAVAVTVTTTATATAPVLTLNPSGPLPPFANTEVGATSASQTLMATNTGDAPLMVSSAALTSSSVDFVVLSGPAGPFTIAPTDPAVSWTIACRPQSFGTHSGTFRIQSNSSTGTMTDVGL